MSSTGWRWPGESVTVCPACGRANTAVEDGVTGWFLCWGCGCISVFTGIWLHFRRMTEAEELTALFARRHPAAHTAKRPEKVWLP